MNATTTQPPGETRWEVTRYLDNSRAIYAQRIGETLEVTDVSLTGGRHYIVESSVRDDELATLVLDYIVQAAELGGRCPMGSS